MKRLLGRIGLFVSCGFIYYMIECFYRGYSDISMFILAGLLGVFCIDTPNNIWSFNLDYGLQVLISTIFCIIGEGITGLIINVWLGLNVWNYSNLWGTFFFGQCNVFFCVIWMLIVGLFGIFYCDGYDYYICHMLPCPYYKIGNKVFFKMKKGKFDV